MACCFSPEDRALSEIERRIRRDLEIHREHYRQQIKILLLGTGEAGKSTIIKQIRMVNGDDFSEKERKDAVSQIHRNVVEAIQRLLAAGEKLQIYFDGNEAIRQEIEELEPIDFVRNTKKFDRNLAGKIDRLWKSSCVQNCHQHRNEFYLSDSAGYFLERIFILCEPDYLPTEEDMMRMRVPTTGIVEYPRKYKENKMDMLFVDVGGQRSERRKWIHAFDNVTCLFYVASLSDYDKTLHEDASTNRMKESLNLFATILAAPHFKKACVILFLNKKDLLEEKLERSVNIAHYFPSFEGYRPAKPITPFEQAKLYFQSLYHEVYESSNPGRLQPIYHHFTCATDKDCVAEVYYRVCDSILSIALQEYQLS